VTVRQQRKKRACFSDSFFDFRRISPGKQGAFKGIPFSADCIPEKSAEF